ncbi:hypothetical protein ASE04_27630 [Rhizobium sp. Root708]|uniref:hypothetical protein n=1 Tax=Rhizobium sp. Root708 TaxID=1736592 RepID=UPI0006FD53E7|nr:hypothetical protein [Rhizobium sp. Root708]KRB58486.1 hypothetical protein ASE04_27630 [Rhizobium sp. Root708]
MQRLAPGTLPNAALEGLADGVCRTLVELEALLPISRRKITDGILLLVQQGYAERVEAGCYQLTAQGKAFAATGKKIGETRGPNTRVRKVRSSTLNQRLWTVMRMSSSFTIADIVISARREEADPEHLARRYVAHLVAAGYVQELAGRVKGNRPGSQGFKRFRLLKNTGEYAPVWRSKTNAVHDFNTGEDVPCAKPV